MPIRPLFRGARDALAVLVAAAFGFPAIAEETADAPAAWKGKISLGGSLSRGNVDSLNGVLKADAERDFDPHLVRLGFHAGYGESDGDKDNDKQDLREYYRYAFRDRLYTYADSLQGRDSVQNIDFRFLVNAGPGYRVWQGGDKRYFDVEGGVGYRHELRRRSSDRSDPTGRVAVDYANLIGIAEFQQTGKFLLPFDDTSAWLARATTSLSFPITDAWSFENSLILEYNNDPAVEDGVPLEEFELDYVVSLVYSF